jgi:pyrroline-5-carboxylate reductase
MEGLDMIEASIEARAAASGLGPAGIYMILEPLVQHS